MTYPSSRPVGPIVPRPCEGHRRRFGEADKRRILEEAAQPDASASEVARRYANVKVHLALGYILTSQFGVAMLQKKA